MKLKMFAMLVSGCLLVSCAHNNDRTVASKDLLGNETGNPQIPESDFKKINEKQFFNSFSQFLDVNTSGDKMVTATFKGFKKLNDNSDECAVSVFFKKYAFWSGDRPSGKPNYQVFVRINKDDMKSDESADQLVWINFESAIKTIKSGELFDISSSNQKRLIAMKNGDTLKFEYVDLEKSDNKLVECFLTEKVDVQNSN